MHWVELLRVIVWKSLLFYKMRGLDLKRLSTHRSPVFEGWRPGDKMLEFCKG